MIFINVRWLYAPEAMCQIQCKVHTNRSVEIKFVHVPSGRPDIHINEGVMEGILFEFIAPILDPYVDTAIEHLARMN